MVLNHDDAVYRYVGEFRGIVSLGPSSGERFDDFVVRRNPDVFAVVQAPPQETAGLAGDRSPASFAFASTLVSTDGVSFAPLAADPDCGGKAPGAALALVVEDATAGTVDNVFQFEAQLESLVVDCPGCDRSQSLCADDTAAADATTPFFEVGQNVDVNLSWWNDHAPDRADILYRVAVYDVACGLLGQVAATRVAAADVAVVDPGQATAGPVLATLAGPALSFVPAASGDYCAVAVEFYDSNADTCPDGFERALPSDLCPAGCTCIGDPDQNPSTAFLTFDFQVSGGCSAGTSMIDRNTLFLTKDPVSPADRVVFAWSTLGPVGLYNVHVTPFKQLLADPAVRDQTPVLAEALFELTVTESLPVCDGVMYVGAFEQALCLSRRSLPDP